MRDWSKEYNALPMEIRVICSAQEAGLRIQHLNLEKERLRKRYRQSCGEINNYIKTCQKWLKGLERE